ncbi:hypothetical protein ACH4FV_37415 [Streptomyces anulatus]
MDWNKVTLFLLSLFGIMGLFLNLTIGFLRQLPELICAWRKLRSTAHEHADCGNAEPELSTPSEAGNAVEAQGSTDGNSQLDSGE